MTLLGFMGKALNLDKRDMEELFDDGMQSIRMTYYPPCPQPERVMGLTPHSDASGITILLQVNGVDGLQVKKDGVWIPVNFLPDAFVVNLGDILEVFPISYLPPLQEIELSWFSSSFQNPIHHFSSITLKWSSIQIPSKPLKAYLIINFRVS